MRRFLKIFMVAALLGASAASMSACSTNPATGRSQFAAFMSESDEIRIGAQQHSEIMKAYGGALDDPEITAWVNDMAQRIARNSERPDLPWTATVLDSPIVNAFALPGGYVYVTRGLIALANTEAELAGVIGHEIGHVTARHSAERYSQSVLAGLGAGILGVATGSREVADLAGLGGALWLSGHSRSQEFEADDLGVRYLAQHGWNPYGMAGMLEQLERDANLQAKILGNEEAANAFSFFSTHPRTPDRVARASGLARAAQADANGDWGRARYLERVHGMVWGDGPGHGYVRGSTFTHPELDFRFEVPEGFRLINLPDRVLATGPQDAAIIFTMAPDPGNLPMVAFVRDVWAGNARLSGLEAITVNGLEAATATARGRLGNARADIRLVAVRSPSGAVWRLQFVTPVGLTASLAEGLQRTTYSLRPLNEAEREAAKPLRLKVHNVAAGETAEDLAARMVAWDDWTLERFRVINALGPDEQPVAGTQVKLIVE